MTEGIFPLLLATIGLVLVSLGGSQYHRCRLLAFIATFLGSFAVGCAVQSLTDERDNLRRLLSDSFPIVIGLQDQLEGCNDRMERAAEGLADFQVKVDAIAKEMGCDATQAAADKLRADTDGVRTPRAESDGAR